MKRVMGLLDKNEEGDGIIMIREWRGWWDYMIRKNEGDGIIR